MACCTAAGGCCEAAPECCEAAPECCEAASECCEAASECCEAAPECCEVALELDELDELDESRRGMGALEPVFLGCGVRSRRRILDARTGEPDDGGDDGGELSAPSWSWSECCLAAGCCVEVGCCEAASRCCVAAGGRDLDVEAELALVF